MKYYSRLLGEFLLYILIMIFLARLGFWQLHRADEKQTILLKSEQQRNSMAHDWIPYQKKPANFEKIRITGQTLKPLIYLDNQVYNHQQGYDVLLPVMLSNGKVVLVDYGWKKNLRRGHWVLEKLPHDRAWEGQVYYPGHVKFSLGNQIEYQGQDFLVLESINQDILKKQFQLSFEPWIIRMQAQDRVFIRDWAVVNLLPQRHKAYALQWFLMSGIVLVIFLWRVFKR